MVHVFMEYKIIKHTLSNTCQEKMCYVSNVFVVYYKSKYAINKGRIKYKDFTL